MQESCPGFLTDLAILCGHVAEYTGVHSIKLLWQCVSRFDGFLQCVFPSPCQIHNSVWCLDFQLTLEMFERRSWNVVRLFSMLNYHRCLTSPFPKGLCDQTLFIVSITDKQGTRHTKSSIKMRTILKPGMVLKIIIPKGASAAIFICSRELIMRWRLKVLS